MIEKIYFPEGSCIIYYNRVILYSYNISSLVTVTEFDNKAAQYVLKARSLDR